MVLVRASVDWLNVTAQLCVFSASSTPRLLEGDDFDGSAGITCFSLKRVTQGWSALILVCRDALESDRVSSQLHQWIDLSFGYQLSGTAAIEAKNVSLPHPTDEMRNRGRAQLFSKPHPRRRVTQREGDGGFEGALFDALLEIEASGAAGIQPGGFSSEVLWTAAASSSTPDHAVQRQAQDRVQHDNKASELLCKYLSPNW